MVELKIDPEFEALIPPLSGEEFKQLRENIISEGKVRDALIIWGDVILDGHNRWRIIQENPNIPFSTEEMNFATRNEATSWMIRNQLGRRNLTNYDRARLALRLKPILVEEARNNSMANLKQNAGKTDGLISDSRLSGKVSVKLAKIAGVGHDTIERVQVIEKSATPEEKQKLSKGEVSVNKVFTAIREREKPRGFTKADREDRAQTEAIVAEMFDTDNIPEMTVEHLIDDIKLNAEEYIRMLRNTLTDNSTILTEENRPIIAEVIQIHVLDKILNLKGIIERK